MIFNYIWNAMEIKPNMAHTKVLRVESTFAYFFFYDPSTSDEYTCTPNVICVRVC